ncbi:hypothetical protein TRAPUB_7258 [Trametes pubescens]|uniref:Uncharacterized protein n=1 Tax=Trametes pubescens TaxID=154538 RepID=A0A1M2V3P5_TRAPU|nr:hypothetical protein TRAPUB_7258 [Trametes pubescens]
MASEAVSVLVGHLPRNGGEYANYNLHKAIFTHVEKKVAPAAPSAACPPLSVIVYAIQNILTITPPSLGLLPSLLQLLVHLEIVRLDLIAKLTDVLRQHDHHASQNDHPVRLLPDADRRALEGLTKPSRVAAQRTVYRELIDSCCLLHIHHLWRTDDPDRSAPITTPLIDYFPSFFARDPATRAQCAAALNARPWHHGITPDELAKNARVGAQAAEFMVRAAQYAADPVGYATEHGYALPLPPGGRVLELTDPDRFAPDAEFDDVFPPPDLDKIAQAVQRFIGMVQPAHDALRLILADRV